MSILHEFKDIETNQKLKMFIRTNIWETQVANGETRTRGPNRILWSILLDWSAGHYPTRYARAWDYRLETTLDDGT